uniref:Uncharacterized protein n=1 Tax=Quercus lobata TaxID=97700 RepID=A0A7N2L454_QUELO
MSTLLPPSTLSPNLYPSPSLAPSSLPPTKRTRRTQKEPPEKELKEVVGFLAWTKTPESLASMEAIAEGNRNNGLQMREMREMLKEAKIRMEAIIEQSDATKCNAMEVVEKLRAIRDGRPSAAWVDKFSPFLSLILGVGRKILQLREMVRHMIHFKIGSGDSIFLLGFQLEHCSCYDILKSCAIVGFVVMCRSS